MGFGTPCGAIVGGDRDYEAATRAGCYCYPIFIFCLFCLQSIVGGSDGDPSVAVVSSREAVDSECLCVVRIGGGAPATCRADGNCASGERKADHVGGGMCARRGETRSHNSYGVADPDCVE